ncbi:hypothetical protein [Haloechinothrix salitolerans]|uniref:SPW repeat-containing protein n=1 Tax=Haloechinothrix salitolerans TaxID=926830 RepID=A0ABW2BW42_9PSEU
MLIVGTLLFPLVARELPSAAPTWLSVVSIVGFAYAACHQGRTRRPVSQGAVAATAAFILILPLLLLGPVADEPGPLLLTAATAPATGAVVGGAFVLAGKLNGSWRKQ